MSNDVFIRAFDQKKDWDHFLELNYQTFWDSIPDDEKIPEEEFRKIHTDMMTRYQPTNPQRCSITIAASDDEPYIGHCWLGVQSDFFTQVFNPWVFDLSVRSQFRSKGIGKMLLDDCVRRCKALGYTSLHLQVLHHNEAALGFYKKCSFTPKAYSMVYEL